VNSHRKTTQTKRKTNMSGRSKAAPKASDRVGKIPKPNGVAELEQKYKDGIEKDLTTMNKEIGDLKEDLRDRIAGLKEWNRKSDANITDLMERVSAREDAAKRHDPALLDKDFDAKMDKFVNERLATIVEAQVKKIMMGQELQTQVSNVVKTLLGHKGKDGTIISATQLSQRGMMKNVKDLKEKNHYRILINKYVPQQC